MSKPKYLIACLLILFLLIPAAGCGQNSQAVDPDKMLTEYTKPAVVRVVSFNMATYYVTSELANFLGIQTQLQYYDGGTGSGAIIAENGYIVANARVVETAKLDDKAAEDRLDKVFLLILC
ncbi:hypothetical protein ACHOLT_15960 [Desulfitobacterium sp. Sab5]|uniref:hypothetical protein n=1 Tax=Desulfitobacterium nosdiversum TaxID=3375356 RepID=UPI003CF0ED2A